MPNTTCWSDNLAKLRSVPEGFYFFYRRLTELRFPLDVAEVLDLRYLFNHAIDAVPPVSETPDYRYFRDARVAELDMLGIEKAQQRERLLRLLALLRELHVIHSVDSRKTEIRLRKAQAENDHARSVSIRYGKAAAAVTLLLAALWLAMSQPGWIVMALTLSSTYLCGDYFFSLSLLKKERLSLGQRLEEVLAHRVKALNWKKLSKNIALTLGYAKISGIEAFLIDKEPEPEDVYRYYM
jgi:hypothetical protein